MDTKKAAHTKELDEHQWHRIKTNLAECLFIADAYRRRVGDEDSIVLEQDLKALAQDLGLASDELRR